MTGHLLIVGMEQVEIAHYTAVDTYQISARFGNFVVMVQDERDVWALKEGGKVLIGGNNYALYDMQGYPGPMLGREPQP